MAILKEMPSLDIVDACRGKLDYYRWCNLVICRSWPRAPGRQRNENVVASQWPFIYINKLASSISPQVHDSYQILADKSGLIWKDYLTRFYINGSIQFSIAQGAPSQPIQEDVSMMFHWLDPSQQIFNFSNFSSDIPWTTYDLTSKTSVNTIAAIIYVRVVCGNYGTTGDNLMYFRKNGSSDTNLRFIMEWSRANWFYNEWVFHLGLDEFRKFQMRFDRTTGQTLGYLHGRLLGYIEQF